MGPLRFRGPLHRIQGHEVGLGDARGSRRSIRDLRVGGWARIGHGPSPSAQAQVFSDTLVEDVGVAWRR